MLANHGLGRHDVVRRTLARCRAILERELGVGCGPETERMAAAIEARAAEGDILDTFFLTALRRAVAPSELSVA